VLTALSPLESAAAAALLACACRPKQGLLGQHQGQLLLPLQGLLLHVCYILQSWLQDFEITKLGMADSALHMAHSVLMCQHCPEDRAQLKCQKFRQHTPVLQTTGHRAQASQLDLNHSCYCCQHHTSSV
jgi:hypothetical protein